MTNQTPVQTTTGLQPSGFQAFSTSPTPWEQARAVYADGRSARSFEHDLILHFERGYVFSTPEVFAMGRPVRRAAPAAEIFNPEVNWPAGECDCWHLYLIAGSPAAAVRLMPYRLPWLSVERGGGLVFFPLKRVVDFFTER